MVSAISIIKGSGGVEGSVTFRQEREGTPVYINGVIYGLKGGYHGMHVHEFGITNGCASAREHFNPFKRQHGDPNDEERHLGDLGNIDASYETGIAIVSKRDNMMSLFGEFSIIGRTLVIHADRDDLGRGNQLDSKTTGHSGIRVACGVIVRQ